jgi:hypothetical protein
MIHAKKPNTMNGGTSESSAFLFKGTVGIKAKIKNPKKSGTTNNAIQVIPIEIGPKGKIHSCPDQVTKKRIMKNMARLLKGLLEKAANKKVMIKVVTKAAVIMK